MHLTRKSPERSAKETISQLKTETSNLSRLVEQGTCIRPQCAEANGRAQTEHGKSELVGTQIVRACISAYMCAHFVTRCARD